MQYTMQNGFDRQWKEKVEKTALFMAPIAVVAVVLGASLTSNTTFGPGNGSKGKSTTESASTGGEGNVAGAWHNAAATSNNNGSAQGSPGGSVQQSSGTSSTASASKTTSRTASGSATATTPVASGGGSAGVTLPGMGGGGSVTPVPPVSTEPVGGGVTVDPDTGLDVGVQTPVGGLDVGVSPSGGVSAGLNLL